MSVGTERSSDFMDWFFDQADYLLNMDDPPSVLLHHMSVLESEVDPELAQYVLFSFLPSYMMPILA